MGLNVAGHDGVPPVITYVNKRYFRLGYANAAPQARKARIRITWLSDTTGETVLPSRLTSGFTAFTSSGMDTFIFLLFWGD